MAYVYRRGEKWYVGYRDYQGKWRARRHADPRITTEVYGHLLPEYLRAEIDRLTFGSRPEPDSTSRRPKQRLRALLLQPSCRLPGNRTRRRSLPPRTLTIFNPSNCGRGETRTHYPRLRRPAGA
jgi:hypothetical protein